MSLLTRCPFCGRKTEGLSRIRVSACEECAETHNWEGWCWSCDCCQAEATAETHKRPKGWGVIRGEYEDAWKDLCSRCLSQALSAVASGAVLHEPADSNP
jgi:hypothetical protein